MTSEPQATPPKCVKVEGGVLWNSSSNPLPATAPSETTQLSLNVIQAPSSAAGQRKRRKVLVLYVGGTLGMCPDANGLLVPKPGYLPERMLEMTDLRHASMPLFDVLEHTELHDSSDLGIAEWQRMARDIEAHYFNYDGFVIAHGTDTMHYSACALGFMLRNLAKPVVLTGSIVPLQEVYNDARRNLVMALTYAALPDVCEVCVCVNDVLLRGVRSTKLADTVQAFTTPNFPPLARLSGGEVLIARDLLQRQPRGPLRVRTALSDQVMCLSVTPGDCLIGVRALFETAGEKRADPVIRVLVLRVNGVCMNAGFPAEAQLRSLGDTAARSGCLVVMCAMPVHGGFNQRTVERLTRIAPEGVVVRDMTAEAAIVKAMYLLGQRVSGAELKRLMTLDMRGEISASNELRHSHL